MKISLRHIQRIGHSIAFYLLADMCDMDFKRKSYNRILRKISEEEGLKDVSLEISVGSSKGDNYMGSIYRVKAHGKRGSIPVTLNIILKTSANEDLRETVPTEVAYKRENFAYRRVLRELQNMQEGNAVDPALKFSFVKCYHTSDEYMEELLVLEDLKVQDFVMYDRLKSTDYSHTALVMTSLGKLHALSYVMKAKKPRLFEELTSKCPDILFNGPFGKAVENIFLASGKKFVAAIEDPGIKAKVDKFSEALIERMQAATKVRKHAVLGHGDCWVNNMLFKYMNGGDGIPFDIRLLDFQLMRYGSPALDIHYFIFCCTDRQFRSKHYHSMLNVYHNTLSACLREHYLDVDSFMSREAFLQEVRETADFGLGMAVMMLRFFLCDVEDVPDIKNMSKNGDVTSLKGVGLKRFMDRVNGVVRDFMEYGYFN